MTREMVFDAGYTSNNSREHRTPNPLIKGKKHAMTEPLEKKVGLWHDETIVLSQQRGTLHKEQGRQHDYIIDEEQGTWHDQLVERIRSKE